MINLFVVSEGFVYILDWGWKIGKLIYAQVPESVWNIY